MTTTETRCKPQAASRKPTDAPSCLPTLRRGSLLKLRATRDGYMLCSGNSAEWENVAVHAHVRQWLSR